MSVLFAKQNPPTNWEFMTYPDSSKEELQKIGKEVRHMIELGYKFFEFQNAIAKNLNYLYEAVQRTTFRSENDEDKAALA